MRVGKFSWSISTKINSLGIGIELIGLKLDLFRAELYFSKFS